MTKRFRLGKLIIVAVLTVLIWVWADRAKTEERTITSGSVRVDSSVDPQLWISISGKSVININQIVIEGSSSSIDRLEKERREKNLTFEFFLNSSQLPELVREGEHTIGLADLIKQDKIFRQLALSVKSCQPASISFQVQKLVEKELGIDCFDAAGDLLETQSIDPPKVKVFVPEDWTQNARIELTSGEINQGKIDSIIKQPFIRLRDEQIRNGDQTVKVKLSPTEKVLPPYTIKGPKIGYVFSQVTQGKFTVNLINQQDVSLLNIRATPEARTSYEQQTYHILLYIEDSDAVDPAKRRSKKVEYNFPKQYVEKGEIQLDGEPATADFTLVPLAVPP